jgi:hypothetical protein
MSESAEKSGTKSGGLSSSKREDIWALVIAAVVTIVSLAAPEGVYEFFKKILYVL